MIEQVHGTNFGVCGARKVHAELRRQGHQIARCTVERLMRTAGLRGVTRIKGPRATVAGTSPETRPDLVERDFTASGLNRLWVADITYCRTFSGWAYASFVIDVFSRQVVGWQVSTSLRTDLALDALEMGLWTWAGQDVTRLTITAINACNTSPFATPSGWPRPAQTPVAAANPPYGPVGHALAGLARFVDQQTATELRGVTVSVEQRVRAIRPRDLGLRHPVA
ncbi:IS3 family transposase [Promicromonospora sukumoe]|uniref:IS3 family transposase n=1 Tax=Promicromonospora sukumoe TaxID=88382 RepID=UPI0037CA6F7A